MKHAAAVTGGLSRDEKKGLLTYVVYEVDWVNVNGSLRKVLGNHLEDGSFQSVRHVWP